MIVIEKQCEVRLSQEEIDRLEQASDILNQIWEVMSANSYIGKYETIDAAKVGEASDILQNLAEIGENIVIEDV
jgi:hypothetical protein